MQHTPLIILDDLVDWQPYHPSQATTSAGDYITDHTLERRSSIINLCDDLNYLSNGAYVKEVRLLTCLRLVLRNSVKVCGVRHVRVKSINMI